MQAVAAVLTRPRVMAAVGVVVHQLHRAAALHWRQVLACPVVAGPGWKAADQTRLELRSCPGQLHSTPVQGPAMVLVGAVALRPLAMVAGEVAVHPRRLSLRVALQRQQQVLASQALLSQELQALWVSDALR